MHLNYTSELSAIYTRRLCITNNDWLPFEWIRMDISHSSCIHITMVVLGRILFVCGVFIKATIDGTSDSFNFIEDSDLLLLKEYGFNLTLKTIWINILVYLLRKLQFQSVFLLFMYQRWYVPSCETYEVKMLSLCSKKIYTW